MNTTCELVDEGLLQMTEYIDKEYKRFFLLSTLLKTQDAELIDKIYYTVKECSTPGSVNPHEYES